MHFRLVFVFWVLRFVLNCVELEKGGFFPCQNLCLIGDFIDTQTILLIVDLKLHIWVWHKGFSLGFDLADFVGDFSLFLLSLLW